MPEPFNEQALSRPEAPPAGHALPGATDSSDPTYVTGMPAPVRPDDPDGTREEIVRTRARMSETIDQIEEQLLRRKERLQEQLDVRGQIRERLAPARDLIEERPLMVFGGVFAAALALGFLTGGRDDDPEVDLPSRGWRGRSRRWERRSRALLRENLSLEAELRALRSRLDEHLRHEHRGRREPARVDLLVELDEHDLPGEYHPSASYDQLARGGRTRDPEDPLQG